jgi:hypothetical protein
MYAWSAKNKADAHHFFSPSDHIKERQGLSFSMRSLTTAKIRRDNLSPSVLSVLLSLA